MPVYHGMFTLYVHCEGAQTNAPPSTTPRLRIGDSGTVTLPPANALRQKPTRADFQVGRRTSRSWTHTRRSGAAHLTDIPTTGSTGSDPLTPLDPNPSVRVQPKRPTLETARAVPPLLVAVGGPAHWLAQTAQSGSSSSSDHREPSPRNGIPGSRHLQALKPHSSADETLSTKYP